MHKLFKGETTVSEPKARGAGPKNDANPEPLEPGPSLQRQDDYVYVEGYVYMATRF